MSATPRTASASDVVITDVAPLVDGGAYPAKCVAGEHVAVVARVFTFGHGAVRANLRARRRGERVWQTIPMSALPDDRFSVVHVAGSPGRYELEVIGEPDPLATWRADAERRLAAGIEDPNDADAGVVLLVAARRVLAGRDADGARQLGELARVLGEQGPAGLAAVLHELEDCTEMLAARPPNVRGAARAPLSLDVARPLAACSAWYECFPRSTSPRTGRHGTLADMARRLEYIADLGFDIAYLPPIHPIGTTARKGAGNAARARSGDPGSPWAIGAAEGGHCSVHPDLGTLEDFDRLVATASALGIEIALDLAFQCSPDHPWVREHPEWFTRRPDGTIACAENPPKRYEDIYPLDFSTPHAPALFEALLSVTLHWTRHGVRVFRVDNPHTKPFALWEWLIAEVKRVDPGVVFLAEAFTRPGPLGHLAKSGFDQSYTYFTWRDTSADLRDYLAELAEAERARTLRPNLWPNTPDILARSLQHGGRPAFVARLVLAACASANYGIYGPVFELLVDTPAAPGREEYAKSEKYEIGRFDLAAPQSIAPVIRRVNAARRAHVALQSDRSLHFHGCDNDRLLCFSKYDEASADRVLCVVNLDPDWAQSGFVDLELSSLGLGDDTELELEDLLDGRRYRWAGRRNYVLLEPSRDNVHLFALTPTGTL